MKRILCIALLFVNLQIVMTQGGLSLTFMTASAQDMMFETLDEVMVESSKVQCMYCMRYYEPSEMPQHQSQCGAAPTTCTKCGQSVFRNELENNSHHCPGSENTNDNGSNGYPLGGSGGFSGGGNPGGSSSGGSSGGGSGSGKPTPQYDYEICEYKTGKLSQHDHNRLNKKDLVVLSNGNEKETLKQVCKLMGERTKNTKKEIAGIKLEDGNYVIFHDENISWILHIKL